MFSLHTLKHELFKKYFVAYLLIITGIFIIVLALGSSILSEVKYYYDKAIGREYVFVPKGSVPPSVKKSTLKTKTTKTEKRGFLFSKLLAKKVPLKPVDSNFGIIIEKIGVNAPIIKNVSVTDEDAYFEALKKGVAHAKGIPGRVGNTYLFAHSSIEFWKMGPYATVFNQLRRLDTNDVIYVMYRGRAYKYVVKEKFVVKGFDTSPLLKEYKKDSVLTLQTCDPPGTTLNRLIVRAYLQK